MKNIIVNIVFGILIILFFSCGTFAPARPAPAVIYRDANRMPCAVEGALIRAAEQALRNVPQRSSIGIMFITAQDRSTADFITGKQHKLWELPLKDIKFKVHIS